MILIEDKILVDKLPFGEMIVDKMFIVEMNVDKITSCCLSTVCFLILNIKICFAGRTF